MREQKLNVIAQEDIRKFTANLVISVILLVWIITAIILLVSDLSNLLIFSLSIILAPGVFIAGMIVSYVLKPRKSVMWIITFLIYWIDAALIIVHGLLN